MSQPKMPAAGTPTATCEPQKRKINRIPKINDFDLTGLGADELTDLLAEVLLKLRGLEAEEIKQAFISKSQKLRLGASSPKENQFTISINPK